MTYILFVLKIKKDLQSLAVILKNKVGDEYHFLFDFTFFPIKRKEKKVCLPFNRITKHNIEILMSVKF